MEVDRRQNLQDDRMSDCWSLGSNYHPSSQSRKISIGIMIDTLERKRSGAPKEDNVVISNADKENCLEDKNKGKGVIDAIDENKQTKAPEIITSPWISTRSFHQKTSTSQTPVFAKETSNLPATNGRRSKLRRSQNVPIAHSVQFFTNQASVLHSGDGEQKKFVGLTYKRKGSKDGNSQREEEFTLATSQKFLESDKAVKGDKREDGRTETLRMKLWEILGAVSSPRSQPSDSQACAAGAGSLKLKKVHQNGDAVVKPIQNSDTIETDSENPDHKLKRPVTRSFTRKRVSTKEKPVKTKPGPSSSYSQKHGEKKNFSFEEGLFRKGDVAVTGGSSMSTRKKGGRQSSGIEPHRIHFTENNNRNEIHGMTHRSQSPPPPEKTSSLSNKIGKFQDVSLQRKGNSIEEKNRNRGDSHECPRRDSHQSVRTNRVDLLGDFRSPAVPEDVDQAGDSCNPSLKNVMEPRDEFQSPTLKFNTPILSSSPSLTPKTDQVEQTVWSPAPAGKRFALGDIRCFRNLETSKDDEVELKDSPQRKPSPLNGTKDVDDGPSESESSSEDEDSKSSEEERDVLSPDTATAEGSTFMFYPAKRLCNHEGNSVKKFGPISPSPNGFSESDWNLGPSEQQNQDNELERVITLFALALKNFKSKMKLATRKKSSEILMSASEEIHSQLQNIVLQIQTDVGKLTSNSKSKRKRLETRFQEQQEKLKLLYDKFKQDIHQHLQDCKSTVEELEMHHMEMKGTLKQQKASHQKLFMKAEEAVETQLNDAHRRVTAVHKSAREKMIQFQQVIAECLS